MVDFTGPWRRTGSTKTTRSMRPVYRAANHGQSAHPFAPPHAISDRRSSDHNPQTSRCDRSRSGGTTGGAHGTASPTREQPDASSIKAAIIAIR